MPTPLDALLTLRLLGEARRSSRRPREWFRRRQEAALGSLLRHAYERVPLYRRLYDAAGFRPEAFRSLEDLGRIPPLTKELLREARPGEAVAAGVDPARCEVVHTSGSTGAPLRIVRDRRDACWIRATAWRILFEHGFRWTDRTLEIRMRPGRTYGVQRLGIARKDWMSILDPPSRWAERLAERRHACVVAGAGTLEDLAVAARGLALRPPRIVVSDSEPLTPSARTLIHDALGTPPIDVYGLEEVSNFAWECGEREGMHVSADSHLIEVEAATGETGPLLVTALGLRAMPIIRYRTGDLATATARDCRCGRTLPLLAAVHGRAVESIDLPGGRRLLWPFFHELLAAEPAVRQWQVQQTATDEILVRVVLGRVVVGRVVLGSADGGSADGSIADRLRSALGSRLRSEIRLLVEVVDAIPPGANGKRRLVIPLAR